MSLTKAQQAEFRPLVKRAWLAQCEVTGVAPNNKTAQDRWYREQLWAAARIRTTKTATEADYKRLIHRFTLLSEAGDFVEISGFTEAQNAVFRGLVESAWRAVCRRDATALQFHAWVDSQLQECRITGRSTADHIQTFDEVMAHFAVIARDLYWITRTAEASERRLRYLIRQWLSRIGELRGEDFTWEYAREIYGHMNLPLDIDEAESHWLYKVFQALDTHLRRLQKDSHATAQA